MKLLSFALTYLSCFRFLPYVSIQIGFIIYVIIKIIYMKNTLKQKEIKIYKNNTLNQTNSPYKFGKQRIEQCKQHYWLILFLITSSTIPVLQILTEISISSDIHQYFWYSKRCDIIVIEYCFLDEMATNTVRYS